MSDDTVRRIALIQGHPDPQANHLGHALAAAYREGAEAAGHEVREIVVARLAFDLLQTKRDFDEGEPPADIRSSQQTLQWADHILIVYPLWLGTMPAMLKGFLEQVFRPGFAYRIADPATGRWTRLLKGKSARILVTMGMPAVIYRWYFRAHSLKSLERNVLGFVGIGPIRKTLIGGVDGMSDHRAARLLKQLRKLGASAG